MVSNSPHCGPCAHVALHLVRLHQPHSDTGLALVLVGRGALEENRHKVEQHGFEFPVVLQERWTLSKEYGIFGRLAGFVDEILALAPKGPEDRRGIEAEVGNETRVV